MLFQLGCYVVRIFDCVCERERVSDREREKKNKTATDFFSNTPLPAALRDLRAYMCACVCSYVCIRSQPSFDGDAQPLQATVDVVAARVLHSV